MYNQPAQRCMSTGTIESNTIPRAIAVVPAMLQVSEKPAVRAPHPRLQVTEDLPYQLVWTEVRVIASRFQRFFTNGRRFFPQLFAQNLRISTAIPSGTALVLNQCPVVVSLISEVIGDSEKVLKVLTWDYQINVYWSVHDFCVTRIHVWSLKVTLFVLFNFNFHSLHDFKKSVHIQGGFVGQDNLKVTKACLLTTKLIFCYYLVNYLLLGINMS